MPKSSVTVNLLIKSRNELLKHGFTSMFIKHSFTRHKTKDFYFQMSFKDVLQDKNKEKYSLIVITPCLLPALLLHFTLSKCIFYSKFNYNIFND